VNLYKGKTLSVAIVGVYSPLFPEVKAGEIMETVFKEAGLDFYLTLSTMFFKYFR